MPELAGLRSGTFAIVFTDQDQSRRLGVFDERHGRTAGIDGGVVVNGSAEIGDHPFVDVILAVIALPVGEASAGNRGAKAMGLRDCPHGHVPTIAPAGNADAIVVYRQGFYDLVDPRQDVAKIAVAEILDVGFGKFLAFSKAAARIGIEDEVAMRGKLQGVEEILW